MPIDGVEEEEASGSRPTPALRRRGRRSSPTRAMPMATTTRSPEEEDASGSRPTPALRRRSKRISPIKAMPTASTTRSRARLLARQLSPAAQSALVPSESAALEQRSKRNMPDTTREDEGGMKEKRRNREREEEEVSSACSSPLRDLDIPDEMYLSNDSGIIKAIKNATKNYREKRGRIMKVPTLDMRYRPTSLLVRDEKLLPVRESATKILLCAAKSVLGLSSSIGGKLLSRSSGFWIDWDNDSKTGTVLTTAHLIRKEFSAPVYNLYEEHEYAPDAEVTVQSWDDSTAEAHLLYYQKHYDLAFFKVKMNQPVQLLSFSDKVKCAQEVFELGRDESSFLKIGHGRVHFLNHSGERYHFMHILGTDEHPQYHNGGPVIDFDGKVVGMVNLYRSGSFVPSSILLKCLHLWRKFRRIPRPHLGLRFSAIKLLDPCIIEKISAKCKIDDGLIVDEVSEGSHAEKLRIQDGDVVQSFNGAHISTTVELENMLLSQCEDGKNGLNSTLDVQIQVLHTRKNIWRNKTLTVNVSDDKEVVARGSYTLTRERILASLDQMGPG